MNILDLIKKIAAKEISPEKKSVEYLKKASPTTVYNDYAKIFKNKEYINVRTHLRNFREPSRPPMFGLLTSVRKQPIFENSDAIFNDFTNISNVSNNPGTTLLRYMTSTFMVNEWNNIEHDERRIMPRFMVHINPMLVLQVRFLLQTNNLMTFEEAWRYTLIGNLILSLDTAYGNIQNYPILAFLGIVFIFYSLYAAPIQRPPVQRPHHEDEHEDTLSHFSYDNWGEKRGGLLDKKNLKF